MAQLRVLKHTTGLDVRLKSSSTGNERAVSKLQRVILTNDSPGSGGEDVQILLGINRPNGNTMDPKAKEKWEAYQEQERKRNEDIKRILRHPVTITVLTIGSTYVLLYAFGHLFKAAATTVSGWRDLRETMQS